MTALSIAIILVGIALPNFSNLTRRIRLTNTTYELYKAINLTRSEAIKRNGKVELSAIKDNWKNGWIISSNDNQNILTHDSLNQDLIVVAKFSDGFQHIPYNGAGRTRNNTADNTIQSGHILLTLGDQSRLIIVNFLGHARICDPNANQNCAVRID